MDSSSHFSEIFEDLVMEMGRAAYFFMGDLPDPDTGQTLTDLESAKSIVDQLEMLSHKTSGNLTDPEKKLLLTTLENVRNCFAGKIDTIETDSPEPPLPPAG